MATLLKFIIPILTVVGNAINAFVQSRDPQRRILNININEKLVADKALKKALFIFRLYDLYLDEMNIKETKLQKRLMFRIKRSRMEYNELLADE